MFKTKKDLDIHVRSLLSKLRSDTDKNLRGLTIGKFYYKINEYSTAEHYLSGYISVKEDNPAAHKLLGQIFLQLKKTNKALASFQRSLQLDPRQHDLLSQVCQLLLSDNTISANKAKYWYELAESERVQNDAVFNLRLKLFNEESNQVEDLILKEISLRPTDPTLRVRYLRYLVDEKNVVDAFKYAYNIEMENHDMLGDSCEWYNTVYFVIKKYEQLANSKKDWQFWLLIIMCLEKQVVISLGENSSLPNGGTTETANLLFNFDQHLFQAAQVAIKVAPDVKLASAFIDHYFGQLCLHAASLIFKRELLQNKNHWKETIKHAVPLLLISFQQGIVDDHLPWIKNCDENSKRLIQLWNISGAFRCAQAGRTVLACIEDNLEDKVNDPYNSSLKTWSNSDDMISQVRQCFSTNTWRPLIFGILFCNSDQKIKDQSSFLIKKSTIKEQNCELPSYSDIETYEEIAQNLKPQSLAHVVYLTIGNKNMSSVRCKCFEGLNYSTKKIEFCGAESLNQLDIATFLYGCSIQASRQLETETNIYENYNSNMVRKPLMMPFVNLYTKLCTEEQTKWWNAAYNVHKNTPHENLAEIRSTLQYGIEAVRGINGPKVDLIIILKLGKIFVNLCQDSTKPIEKSMLDARVETLYTFGLTLFKLHIKGVLEPFRKLFKYSIRDEAKTERELCHLADEAASFIATRFIKKAKYDECIEQLSGIQLPYATYFLAEAYRQLDESKKTPKKDKSLFLDRSREYLNQTFNLLKSANYNNHPLNVIIQSEMKRLSFSSKLIHENKLNNSNSSNYEDAEAGEFPNDTQSYHWRVPNREAACCSSRNNEDAETGDYPNYTPSLHYRVPSREAAYGFTRNNELEGICKQMASTLSFLKEELINAIKPEVTGLRKEIIFLKEKLNGIEETLKKKSNAPSREDAANVLEDLYMIDDELQNQLYSNQQSVMYGNYGQQQNNQKLMPGNLGALTAPINQPNPYSSPMFNQTYPMNYYQGQYMVPPATGTPINFGHNTQLNPRNLLGLKMESSLPMVPNPFMQSVDNRNSGFFNLLPPNSAPLSQPDVSATLTNNVIVPSGSFNKIVSNQPVERGPPVNVVITSSDPLPINPIVIQSQPTLSVTIPSHHIKQSISSTEPISSTTTLPSSTTNLFGRKPAEPNFSFKLNPSQNVDVASDLNKTSESVENEANSSETEYDPRPDFQPIIPLPAEIEVKTGEENEEVLFCARAKLYRHSEKDWKERGVGEFKILKNSDNKFRILMRRDQIHKICANHQISSEMFLTRPNNETKGYIWAANDFADEVLSLEKFLVRFKLPDIATEFYNVFTKCRNEAKPVELKNVDKIQDIEKSNSLTKTPSKVNVPDVPHSFFASSITKNTIQPVTSETTLQPFASFTFDKMAKDSSKPFANLFGNINRESPALQSTSDFSSDAKKEGCVIKLTTDETQDDYVPTAEFAPVIALPDLVEITTGEENEVVLFEHRAKLLRFDKTSNEWKERGLGNIKLLKETTDKNKVRLVMRREIIHKLCCNQRLYKDTVFKYPKNSKNALMWVGQDFSESELTVETLTIRFKTAVICEQFYDAVIKVQANMDSVVNTEQKSDNKGKPEVSQTAIVEKGFGDKFKPKLGSWTCEGCYTSNMNVNVCIACETPREKNNPKMEDTINKEVTSKLNFGFASSTSKNFGDQFKPKVGSWECKGCYISNAGDVVHCVACNTPKNDTIPPKEPVSFLPEQPKSTFSFGFLNTNTTVSTSTPAVGFGDKFKPNVGSWTCESCYISNTIDSNTCIACNAGKGKHLAKLPSSSNIESIDLSTNKQFSFGFSNLKEPKSIESPLNFVINTEGGNNLAAPENVFGSESFKFTVPSTQKQISTVTKDIFTFAKTADSTTTSSGKFSLDKPEFSFTLKSKSPSKSKGAVDEKDEEDEDEEACEEEENNTYFTPVIPLPDKIEVRTGEEDEEVLYSHRSKLFRFIDSEWKERGLGEVKILRHIISKKLRVVMRREKVLKICLNHALNASVEYKPKDEKSWHFVVNDFSEGEVELMQFCLRFKSKEVADQFYEAVKNAISNDKVESTQNSHVNDEYHISEEYKELADRLNLPYNYFQNSKNTGCVGCRGCNPDEFVFPEYKEVNQDIAIEKPLPIVMPSLSRSNVVLKHSSITFESQPVGSKTDSTFKFSFMDQLADTKSTDKKPSTIFGTPDTKSIFSGTSFRFTNQAGPIFGSNSINTIDVSNQSKLSFESTTTTQPSVFTGVLPSSSLFGATKNALSENNESNLFFGSVNTPISTSGSLFGNATRFNTEAVNPDKHSIEQPMFKDIGIDFASLAQSTTNQSVPNFQVSENTNSGFVGLTNTDAFKSFLKPSNAVRTELANTSSCSQDGNANEEEHDPHFEPIIELPQEIVVSTGEEEEIKIFGERATLFRYDGTNKEWKERGVGEFKILHHPSQGSFRLLLRREQIHKLVLNHAIVADFHMQNMGNNPKAFVWAALNYAEETPQSEQLAVRFKNVDLANKFKAEIGKCVDLLQKRADLEPEED